MGSCPDCGAPDDQGCYSHCGEIVRPPRTMPVQKPGRSKQDYGTPWEFIEAVKGLLGIKEFDRDLAATAENAKCPVFITPEMDSFTVPWWPTKGWNWLNPPFSRIGPWVARAWEQYTRYQAHTAVLVPAGVGANWWRDHVHMKAQVLLLNGRLTFEGEAMPYPKDCALLRYGRPKGYWVWNWKQGLRGLQ